MATDFSKLKDLNLSQEEIGSFSKAFKDEEFRKLFREYAEEISDPVNRQKYEEELAQMERDRGMDVQFIHPTPGYVMKTSIDGEKKAFINICTSDLVGKPSSSPGTDKSKPGGMKSGVQWSIPYSLAPPREDLDKTGNRCMVYDCVFHPDTLQIAERNQRFRTMINDTAMDGIETNFKVKLDRTNLRCPKMQYKGKPTASVIRTPRKEGATGVEDGFKSFDVPYPYNEPSREDMPPKSNTTISGNRKGANESNASAPTVPKHTIVHRGHFDIQNFRDAPDAAPTTRPQELVITVQLPLLKSAKTLNLDIYERQLCLESSKPAAYKLDIKLPYPVDENRGSAKFDKSKRCLTVTIPVLAPEIPDLPSFVEGDEKQLVEELHDEEKNTQETVAEKKEEEVVVKEEAKLDDTEMDLMVADAVERETEKNENIQQVPALTKNTDKKSETIDTSVQQVESGSIDSDELSEKEEFQHEAETNNMATVLEPPVYLMPDYSYRQDSETITFVLHVPCVKADSVKKQLVCGLSGLHVTMETKPENNNQEVRNYSFYAQFLPCFSISPDIICDIFNDKIILLLKKMTEKGSWKTFRVGKDEHCLKERNFLDSETLQSTIGDIVKRTLEETTKYQDKYMECEVTESTDDKLVIEIKPSTGGGDSKLANTADVTNGGQNQHHESGAYESAEAVARQMNALNLQNVDDVGEWESESSSASSPVDKEDPNAPKSAFKSQTRKITKSVSFNETVMVENFKERSKKTQKKKPGKVESSFRTKERLKESSEEESESPRSPTSPLNFTDIPNVKEKNRPGSPKKGKNKSKSKNRENAKNKKSEDFAKKTMDSAGGDEKTEVTDSRTSRKNDASVDMKHKSNGKSGMAFANTLMYDLD